jgi:PAS domain-containing protein
MHEWVREFPGAFTICNRDGIIIEMNDRSIQAFEKDGGSALIGKNVLDCHLEPARTELKNMLASGKTNVYTIEKNGLKKLIYQAPWYSDGEYRGFVELALEIPVTMPHHVRV